MCAASCAQEDALGDTSSYRILTEIRGCTNSYPSAERAAGAGERGAAEGGHMRALGQGRSVGCTSQVKLSRFTLCLDLT